MIEGIKVIRHNAGGINGPDDPSYPFKLEIRLRPPEMMIVAFIGLYGGTEEIIVRAKTREALAQFVDDNALNTHPRLRSAVLTDAAGHSEDLALAWRTAREALR